MAAQGQANVEIVAGASTHCFNAPLVAAQFPETAHDRGVPADRETGSRVSDFWHVFVITNFYVRLLAA